MEFKNVIDINGQENIYPNQTNLTIFFKTDDERFFIYALCTNDEYKDANLIEVENNIYLAIKETISNSKELIEINVQDKQTVDAIILFSELKSLQDNLSVGTTLDLY